MRVEEWEVELDHLYAEGKINEDIIYGFWWGHIAAQEELGKRMRGLEESG